MLTVQCLGSSRNLTVPALETCQLSDMMLNRLLTIELGKMAAVAEDILHLLDSLTCVALGTVLQLLCSSLLLLAGHAA